GHGTGDDADLTLVQQKELVGGGEITIVNKTVPMALDKLGYAPDEVKEIEAFIDERNTIVSAPYVKSEHYPVFDCAIGDRAIHYTGHVKMMGAVQPFISGAISKTVNLPETATVDEVAQLYVESWKPGDIFIDIAKEGTTLAGLMNSFMISVSLGLQYGVPLEVYVSKFAHMRFEPSGMTNDPDIRVAKSIVDYVFRWMGKKFLTIDQQEEIGVLSPEVRAR